MGLPRTFVSFSSTDIKMFWMMLAWKASEHIDFDFTNCQLSEEVDSENENYIKKKCRERIDMAGTFAVLIGEDTKSKHKYVGWEIDVAIEKGCRIICINLDGGRIMNPDTCPDSLQSVGAIFVPFSAKIIAYALESFEKKDTGWWYYKDDFYDKLYG